MVSVRYTRNLFLRGVCIIYLAAFLSFYIQIPGLYGDNGVLPARTQLDLTAHASLYQKFKQKPTLLWFAPYIGLNAEYMLDVLSLSGTVLSFLGFVSQKFCIAPVLATLWILYYSLYQIGQTFMWIQWDNLLLETGFLCIFVAPFYQRRGKPGALSDAITFWSIRWLLFRVMFSNGIVKLTSGCPSWWKLDALNVYFESQCIPTPLAWYAHHLPAWLLRLGTAAIHIMEIFVPFLFFFPLRKVRIVAFYLQVFYQIIIVATGNYNFNFFIICLCISLLDDEFFHRRKPKNDTSNTFNRLSTALCLLVYAGVLYGAYKYYKIRITDNWTISSEINFTKQEFDAALSYAIPASMYIGLISLLYMVMVALNDSLLVSKRIYGKIFAVYTTVFYTAVVCFVFAVSLVPHSMLHQSSANTTIPAQVRLAHAKVEHLHLVNSYGHSIRPTSCADSRLEIIIEGSNNFEGQWKEYEFLYKPGNVNNSLPFVVPHQPRLDWQMWTAAWSTYHKNPWLMSLAYRLLNAQPEVLALMNKVESPFQDKPPKYIRASLYRYHYTPWNRTGTNHAWWVREKVGDYLPMFNRNDESLNDYLAKLKIVQNKPIIKATNEPLKIGLDTLRLMNKIEASLLLWGVITAGLVIILTNFNSVGEKKKH